MVVYTPIYTTDWLYKKSPINARVIYKPLFMSRYTQANFDINVPANCPPVDGAIRYGIYENNRLVGIYPLDNNVLSGSYKIYLRKNQEVRFIVEENYANRFEIV